MKQTVSLIIPPSIDWTMPLLACPLLKPYIDSNYNVHILDINTQFFNNIWECKNLAAQKNGLNKSLDNKCLIESVTRAVDLIDEVSYFDFGNSEYILLRKVHITNDWLKSESVYELLNGKPTKTEGIIRNIVEKVKSQLYDNVAFCLSISIEDQILPSFILMKLLRNMYPNTPIVIGGNIVSRLSEGLAKSKLSQYFDVLLVGEGEDIALKTITELEATGRNSGMPRIITNNDKVFEYSKLKTPDFSWCNSNDYLAVKLIIPITLNRKCDWAKCEFCAIHACWGVQHRTRDINDVINDIKYYVSTYGVQYFRIVDENVSSTLMYSFAEKLISNDLHIFYEAYTRFDSAYNDEHIAKTLYLSGCRQLFWGIESADEQVLRTIKKGTTVSIMSKNLNVFANSGILNYCFVLTGLPNVATSSEEDTLRYVINNKDIHVVAMGSYVLDRLSPMHLDESLWHKYNITLEYKGDLTTEIGFKYDGHDIGQVVKARTKQYIEQLYTARGDYALSSVLDEETRFILCSIYGNDFAKTGFEQMSSHLKNRIFDIATNRSAEERVLRNVEETK